ncbi:hypothetical protein IEO21_07864 [Rhodonia placenta]|uniref:Uncharacterized protein n=1 Tax=Rhodonia placenta TaxID=104341 RepID=A0A8H7NXL0_9APHY|nr:hypothetical protein IEO21_07864 [Postia placenta]
MAPNDASTGKPRSVEVLEVEDDDQRQQRMSDIFRRLNSPSQPLPRDTPTLPVLPRRDDGSLPAEPSTDLLSRVQAFLPQLAASNADLLRRAQEDPSSVDIENTADAERIIEMNLGLGVFEQRAPAPSTTAYDADLREDDADATGQSSSDHSDTDSSDSDSETESSDSTSNSNSNSDSDADASMDDESSPKRPIKPLPRGKSSRPEIVMLDGDRQPTH